MAPLVNFLVNGTSDANELADLRQKFGETITPQLSNLSQTKAGLSFSDGRKDTNGAYLACNLVVSPIFLSLLGPQDKTYAFLLGAVPKPKTVNVALY